MKGEDDEEESGEQLDSEDELDGMDEYESKEESEDQAGNTTLGAEEQPRSARAPTRPQRSEGAKQRKDGYEVPLPVTIGGEDEGDHQAERFATRKTVTTRSSPVGSDEAGYGASSKRMRLE